MSKTSDVNGLCLEAFAGISAIVTHDLKNTLAIINENAGLLDDLAIMSGENGGVPIERVQGASAKIAQQVARSNTIIKNLNRFAHSGDAPVAQASVEEVLKLMVALTARKASMRNVSVVVEEGEEQVETSLFHLETLIYRILLHIYNHSAQGTVLTLSSSMDSVVNVIRFAVDLTEEGAEVFPGASEQVLLDHLGGSMERSDGYFLLKI